MGEATANKMKKGEKAPDFPKLPSPDGKSYGLSDFQNKNVLVIFFSCNHCPYVQAYEDRIISLQNEFADKAVQFIAINSNDASNYPEDSFENMKKRATSKKFNFVYLRDESQDVAKSFGATHTPHLFVFDKNRELAYTGRIDDNVQDPNEVKKTYLKDVLNSLTQDQTPPLSETFAVGCTIKWK